MRLTRLGPMAVALTTVVSLAAGAVAPAATATSAPPFVGWSVALPPLADRYQPDSADACAAGLSTCVQTTIRSMTDRTVALKTVCSHKVVFSLAYLRTTQTYAKVAAEPGYFQDVRFVNHEDSVFAKYYFSAYDNFVSGRLSYVPVAWRTAFQAAKDRTVSGAGDLMLGMSAHVNRDLPFVLAAIGLVTPSGASRKPDHDKVNVFLNQVVQPLIDEEAARFDPTVNATDTPYGISYTALMQALVAWREGAWRNAERLVAATTDAQRAQVADSIETSAAATAQSLVATYRYVPPVTSTTARDAYCALHHG